MPIVSPSTGTSGGTTALTIAEVDGAPSVSANALIVSNGSLTDSGGGTATVTTTAGGGTVTAFTPTWGAATTNPTLGDGTLTGHYQQLGDKVYFVSVVLTYGSTSSAGTGVWSFGLPLTLKSTTPAEQTIAAMVRDAGTTRFTCTAALSAGGTSISQIIVGDGTGARQVSNTAPITWANGDQVFVQGVIVTDS